MSNCAWYGTVADAGSSAARSLLDLAEDASLQQLRHLLDGLRGALDFAPAAGAWPLVIGFEPEPGMRAADAILLASSYMFVLTLGDAPHQAILDRAMAQARDLRRGHAASRRLTAIPVVVLQGTGLRAALHDGVCLVSPDKLFGLFKMFGLEEARAGVDVKDWLESPFSAQATTSLCDFEEWVACVVAGRLGAARLIANGLRDQGFDLYVTANAGAAAEYLRVRYGELVPGAFEVTDWRRDPPGQVSCGRDGNLLLVPSGDAAWADLVAAGAAELRLELHL